MAIAPEDEYPGQVDTSDGNYPYGKARNDSAPDSGDGTPLEQLWLRDLWGFLQGLLRQASVVPSGTPDHATAAPSAANAQHLHALRTLLCGRAAVFDILGASAVVAHNGLLPIQGSTGYQSPGAGFTVVDAGLNPANPGVGIVLDDILTLPWPRYFLATLNVTIKDTFTTTEPGAATLEIGQFGASPRQGRGYRFSANTAHSFVVSAANVAAWVNQPYTIKNVSGHDIEMFGGTFAGQLTLTEIPGAGWA